MRPDEPAETMRGGKIDVWPENRTNGGTDIKIRKDTSGPDRRSVGKAEWHHFVLEISIARPESRFPLVPRLDAHQIVGAPKVDFREDTPSSKSIEERWN